MMIRSTANFTTEDEFDEDTVTYVILVPEDARGTAAVLIEAAQERFRETAGAAAGEDGDEEDASGGLVSWGWSGCWWGFSATAAARDEFEPFSALVIAEYDQAAIDAAFARLQEAEHHERPRICPTAEQVRALQKRLAKKGAVGYDVEDSDGDLVCTGKLWLGRKVPRA